jgi:cbb3-type cytochrome oxidase subunit 3
LSFPSLAYTLFTLLLVIVFVGIIVYYYNPKRKQNIEAPKHRMLEDDESQNNSGSQTNR